MAERPDHLRPVHEGETELDHTVGRALARGFGPDFDPKVVLRVPHQDEHGHSVVMGAKTSPYFAQAMDACHGRGSPFKDRSEFIRDCFVLGLMRYQETFGGNMSITLALTAAASESRRIESDQLNGQVIELAKQWHAAKNTPRSAEIYDDIMALVTTYGDRYPEEAQKLQMIVVGYSRPDL